MDKRIFKFYVLRTAFYLSFFSLFSCSYTVSQHEYHKDNLAWVNSITQYPIENNLVSQQLKVSPAMREEVIKRFSHLKKDKAVDSLARWLMSKNGHQLEYDLSANLTPTQAFEQKRGNCLTFTTLLVSLAQELDIELQYNDVYLPNTWEFEDQTTIYLRHINAIYRTPHQTKVIDLAVEIYDVGYPQKIITPQQAVAWLYSNLATQSLKINKHEDALNLIKTSIALYPEKADFWINLGSVYNNLNDNLNAERAFLHALNLKSKDSLAARNLERLYENKLDHPKKAAHFKKLAHYAKQQNPYTHYLLAKNHLSSNQLGLARKSIRKAIKLHDQDSRFYLISSQIEVNSGNIYAAVQELDTAYSLALVTSKREKYYAKALKLIPLLKAQKNSEVEFNENLFDSNNQ